jgi:hypothetical protein
LFFCSGLAFWLVGPIKSEQYRYFVFNLFQIGSSNLFDLAGLKFETNKDNFILTSNIFISPIVNVLSSALWSGPILVISYLLGQKKDKHILEKIWKQVFFTNLAISLIMVLIWHFFADLDSIYFQTYDSSNNPFGFLLGLLYFIFFIPSVVPSFLAQSALDNGMDTVHGYEDLYLVSRVNGAFVCVFWSIFLTMIRNKSLIRNLINEKIIKT